jgi:hypothetical protein
MAVDKNEILLQIGVTMLTVAMSTAVTIYVTQNLANKRKEDEDEATPNPPPFMLPDNEDKFDALEKKLDKLASNPAPTMSAPVAAMPNLDQLHEELRRNSDKLNDLREAMYRRSEARFSH